MAGKSNGLEASAWAREPPSGSAWERFCRAIYDPDEKSFLGRTCKRWAILFVFYGIFYAILAGLFAACMAGLFYTLNEERPTWTLHQSLIGANPGVTFRPSSADSLELRYQADNLTHYTPLIMQLKEFLTPYQKEEWLTSKQTCTAADNYGLPYTPCFFIKINKIYDWIPEYYNDVNSLPDDMPDDLKDYIRGLLPAERKQVWISCSEEKGNTTKIEYPWSRGLAGSFFPYTNEEGYVSPLLAVRFTPEVNTSIVIRCRAWAKNIIYNKSIKEASGYSRIQLFIEDNTNHDTTEAAT